MMLLEGTNSYGQGGNEEQPRVGGAGPTSGGGYFQTGTGGGPRFLTHSQAREQIMGITQPGGSPDTTTQGNAGGGRMGGIGSQLPGRSAALGEEIRGAGETFRNDMGQATPYSQERLLEAIMPGSSPDARERGKASALDQLDSSYGGPSSLSPETVAKIAQGIGNYELEARNLQTGGGVADAIKRRTPRMTQGEAMFEAERVNTPELRDSLIPQVQQAANLRASLDKESARAMEAANLRVEQEKQISGQARDFLKEQKTGVYDRLQGEVDAKTKANEAAKAAYDAAVADPNAANLGALDPYTEADLAALSGAGGDVDAAKAAYADVMRRYAQAFPEIAAYPPLQRIITKRGEEYLGIPNADGTVTDIRKVKGMSKETERHLRARQAELEKLFEPLSPKHKGPKEEGEFANLMPLYYGDNGSDPLENAFEGPAIPGYLSLDEGNSPTMEMLATSDDRTLVDNVNALIEESDRLMETGEVFRAAAIAADVDKYLHDREEMLRTREGELDEREQAGTRAVRRARNRFKKAKAKRVQEYVVSAFS